MRGNSLTGSCLAPMPVPSRATICCRSHPTWKPSVPPADEEIILLGKQDHRQ